MIVTQGISGVFSITCDLEEATMLASGGRVLYDNLSSDAETREYRRFFGTLHAKIYSAAYDAADRYNNQREEREEDV